MLYLSVFWVLKHGGLRDVEGLFTHSVLERASASELASGRTVRVTSGWTVSHPSCHDSILCNTHEPALIYRQRHYIAYRLMLLNSQPSVEWDCVVVIYMLGEWDYDCTHSFSSGCCCWRGMCEFTCSCFCARSFARERFSARQVNLVMRDRMCRD